MVRQKNAMANVFNEIIGEYKLCVAKIAKKHNLYMGQTEVLFLLKDKPGWTQKDLANELGVSKATIGVSLRRMELAGLVNRITDLQDARCIRVSLTDKGTDVCDKCNQAFKELYEIMFASFTGEKNKQALDMLTAIKDGLTKVKKV